MKKPLAIVFLFFLMPNLYAEEITIVALGDSTTAGTPAFFSPAEIPPAGKGNPESQYAYWLEKSHPGWKVLNRGIRGERTDQILARFESDVLANRPQAVIVLAGVNDLYQGRDAESVKRNLEKIYRKAAEHKIKVAACTILPYSPMRPDVPARMAEVNAWIRGYARQNGLAFCDTAKALENPASPNTLMSSPDGLHPDAAGYRRMAEVIALVLLKLLQNP